MKIIPLFFLSGLLTMALGGCSSDQPAKSPDSTPSTDVTSAPPTTTPAATATTDMSAPTTPTTPPAATASTTPADAPLTDDQIIQVTHTANQGEIDQAKLAQSKAKDPRVKKLAAMMLKDHSDADAKGMTLVKKANLNPSPSSVSTSLQSDAQSATTTLQGQSGADFDKNYVDTQVKEHQAVLDTIDQKLVPNAKGADLKAYLAEVRPKIAMHLQHAQDLQKDMQK